MKRSLPPHRAGRKRKCAGWVLLALGVIVAGVWGVSGRWWLRLLVSSNVSVEVRQGVLNLLFRQVPQANVPGLVRFGHVFGPGVQRWYWWVGPDETDPSMDQTNLGLAVLTFQPPGTAPRVRGAVGLLELAFWPVAPLLCTPAALLLRSGILARRRAMTGSCAKCGYSLAGLGKEAPCPECGREAINHANVP